MELTVDDGLVSVWKELGFEEGSRVGGEDVTRVVSSCSGSELTEPLACLTWGVRQICGLRNHSRSAKGPVAMPALPIGTQSMLAATSLYIFELGCAARAPCRGSFCRGMDRAGDQQDHRDHSSPLSEPQQSKLQLPATTDPPGPQNPPKQLVWVVSSRRDKESEHD